MNTLLGNGNGTFHPGPVSTTNGCSLPVLRDLNGDGISDLVGFTSQGTATGVGVCFGNGDGTFQPAVFYPIGIVTRFQGNVVVGDFNKDGILDVVTVSDSGIWLFTGKGRGALNPAVLTPISSSATANGILVTADFNGDGNLDLAVTWAPFGLPNGFSVLLGNGDGTFQTPTTYVSLQPRSLAVADFNLDGHPDIVLVLEYESYDLVYLNNGSGGFVLPNQVTMASTAPVAVGDVNGDNIPDLVNNAGFVALGLGDGTFQSPVGYPVYTDFAPETPVLADLRNIGLTDIITGELGAFSVLLNTGRGTFGDGVWTSVPGSGNCGAAADFNGDGKPDLAIPTSQGLTVMLGTGKHNAPYMTGETLALSSPGCPITGDINGDGIPDLLIGAGSVGGVAAYLGNGDGTFRLASTTTVNPGFLVLGDFNHDGKLDFADSSNQLALGNGDGTFQAPLIIVSNPPSGGFSYIAAGDLNHDGWTDLLLTNWNVTRAVYVLLNNQQGGFNQSSFTNSEGPDAVFLADFNGDGNLDAAVETFYGYDVYVYLGDGKGGFTLIGSPLYYTSSYPVPPSVGDVNGDGIPDVLLPGSGSIEIYLGKGDGTFVTPIFGVGTGGGVGQICFESMHGQSLTSGLPDLVAPDGTGGVMVLYNQTK